MLGAPPFAGHPSAHPRGVHTLPELEDARSGRPAAPGSPQDGAYAPWAGIGGGEGEGERGLEGYRRPLTAPVLNDSIERAESGESPRHGSVRV